MRNPFLTPEGRNAFRHEFPADSRVVPIDILPTAHEMLRAIDEKDAKIAYFDREIVGMLRQAVEHPTSFASSWDGLHNLFYANLYMRGMIHGDSSMWRTAVRRAYPDNDDSLHRSRASLPEYAKLLWKWVEAFDVLIKESQTARGPRDDE